jgi:hypothetical protein
MKLINFFKILHKKVNKYDSMASNPFKIPQPITLVWVDKDEVIEDEPPLEQ